ARAAAGHPLLVLGILADDELAEDAPAAALDVEALALANLPAAATEELVRAVVRLEKTVHAVAPVLREQSEGNPLIVLEVLAHLEAAGVLAERADGLALVGDLGDVAMPSTLRDLVGLKLKALDEEQRETLEAASVLGVEFEAPLLADVLDEKPIEISQRLAALERKQRLLQSAGQSSFRFASRQLFEAIYEGIPDGLRAEYHDLVAETLLEEDPEPTAARAYAVLRHLHLAERGTEAEPFLESALDYMAANFHASFAVPFLEKIAEEFADAPAAARFALAMKLWAFYDVLGSREDQMRVLEPAAELAAELGDTEARARVHALRAGSFWYAGDFDAAGKEAEAGLALAREAGSRKWESTCHHTLGVVDYRRGDLQACANRWREALAIRKEIGDRRGEASTLQALSLIQPAIGEGDKVLGTMQEALAIWREIGERRGEAATLMNIGNHFVDTARYDEGLRHLEQATEGHRETGDLFNEALTLTNLGRAQHILGRIDDARVSLERALG
ncbi:MAG: tetratricopeptide repeat protein, partial [Deltaproteobacteria bacterium]